VDRTLGREAGGRLGLGRLLDEHWDTLEADFQRLYHLDLSEAVFGEAGTPKGRLAPRKLLNLIHQLAAMPDSLLYRHLRGPMAVWDDMTPLLLRQILLTLQGANWQRSGGKGSKPKPIPLPDNKGRGDQPASKPSGEEIAQRLKNLGLLPSG
jgi:hypothetical protein